MVEPTGLRVLVVERSPFIAGKTASSVKRVGCRVIGPAMSIDEAEALLAATSVDAALLDVEVDGGSTFDLARRLQANGVPVVFYAGTDRRDQPDDLSHVLFCTKPTDPGPLVARVAAEYAKFT